MDRVIERSTVEPVTSSGWYECRNGQIARYEWKTGRLVETRRVGSWVLVPTRDARIHDGEVF